MLHPHWKLTMVLATLLTGTSCGNQEEIPLPSIPQSRLTTLTWENPGPDATVPRFEAQGLALHGKLYVFGGFYKQGPPQATVQSDAYHLQSDTWTPLAPLQEKLTHAGQATDGTFIYLAGGFVGDHPGGSSKKLWKYDVEDNSWSEGPPMPEERGGGALVFLNNSLHYFGGAVRPAGGDYEKDYGDHWVLQLDDPTGKWNTAAPLPNPRNHMGGCAVEGKIYAVGGQHLGDEKAGNQKTMQVYDPGTDSWTNLAELPVPKGHVTANVLEWNGRIIVVSGVTQRKTKLASVDEYDPKTNAWSALTPLPKPRQSPVAGIIGDTLIVSGGSTTVTTWVGKLAPRR